MQRVLDDSVKEQVPPTMEAIVEAIAEYYNPNRIELVFSSKEKKIVQSKSVICFLAMRQYRKTGVEVVRRLGYSTSATRHATKRGRIIVGEDVALQRHIAMNVEI